MYISPINIIAEQYITDTQDAWYPLRCKRLALHLCTQQPRMHFSLKVDNFGSMLNGADGELVERVRIDQTGRRKSVKMTLEHKLAKIVSKFCICRVCFTLLFVQSIETEVVALGSGNVEIK